MATVDRNDRRIAEGEGPNEFGRCGPPPVGIAYASAPAKGKASTTSELKINFSLTGLETRFRSESHIVKRDQAVGLVDGDVAHETGSLAARGSGTCLTLSAEKAAGR